MPKHWSLSILSWVVKRESSEASAKDRSLADTKAGGVVLAKGYTTAQFCRASR